MVFKKRGCQSGISKIIFSLMLKFHNLKFFKKCYIYFHFIQDSFIDFLSFFRIEHYEDKKVNQKHTIPLCIEQ